MELKKGYFITFEGADGCGKTTQIKLINQWLNENSIDTVLTLEPGDTELGKSLRQILLHYDKPVANTAEAFLYLADRAQHVKYLIQPALKDKKVLHSCLPGLRQRRRYRADKLPEQHCNRRSGA